MQWCNDQKMEQVFQYYFVSYKKDIPALWKELYHTHKGFVPLGSGYTLPQYFSVFCF